MTGEPALPAFFRIHHHARVASTNDEARRLAAAGEAEGALVWADAQSAGRGRGGRNWDSPPGNLYISLVLRPRCAAADAAQLGFAASLAVADAAQSVLPASCPPTCKWPNDVLVAGAKLAGILLESQGKAGAALDWLVVGIGVNIASFPEGMPYPATSLAASGARGVTPAGFLPILAVRLLAWYDAWRGPDGFPALRAAWLARAHRLGEAIQVRLPDAAFEGRFVGLDEHGRLVLDGPDGRRHIAAADVFPAA